MRKTIAMTAVWVSGTFLTLCASWLILDRVLRAHRDLMVETMRATKDTLAPPPPQGQARGLDLFRSPSGQAGDTGEIPPWAMEMDWESGEAGLVYDPETGRPLL